MSKAKIRNIITIIMLSLILTATTVLFVQGRYSVSASTYEYSEQT